MIITVLMPGNHKAILDVADGFLVFDGQYFVEPYYSSYVELYTLPVYALSLEYRDQLPVALQASVRIRALVINKDPTQVPDTDPSLVVELDPASGQCVCGLTCNGTDLRFVTVYPEP